MQLPTRTIETLSEFVPAEDLARMRVVTAPPWRWLPVLLGMSAITFAPFVFVRKGHYRTNSARGLALMAHEAVHIGQVRELGRMRFYSRYLIGQLRSGFRHDRHAMEIPGIEVQRHVRSVLDARGGGGAW